MSDPVAQSPVSLSLSAERRVDEVCTRFEAALKAGPARIEDYLGGTAEPERSALLCELLRLEVEYRFARGEQPTVDEYCCRFPTHSSFIASWYPADSTVDGPAPTERMPTWPDLPAYEFVAELPPGGMGVVYKARHVPLRRVVALKMIRAGDHASDEQKKRFLTEARVVARLENPNIVQIHEIGEHDGMPYFTMEFVEGGSLAARLQGAPFSDKEAAQLVELLARTIHYAHGRGIVHRDLKPANILLASDGIPKIADFGLAKMLTDESGATLPGTVIGTPSYMAPEAAAGKIKDVGPAADIYALGAILYELLTSRPPFRGETTLETLRLVEEQPPDPPHIHNPRVDRALEAVCLKCLEKAPQDRYASAQDLADDLAAFGRGELVAPESGAVGRLFGGMLAESRYSEVMILWSSFWLCEAVNNLLLCLATAWLFWCDVTDYAPYYFVWGSASAYKFIVMWLCRLRAGPRLSQVEWQLVQIWVIHTAFNYVTLWMYQRTGGAVIGVLPILSLWVVFAYVACAVILGCSFHGLAAAGMLIPILQLIWPIPGLLISAVVMSPALFWYNWTYYRQRPSG